MNDIATKRTDVARPLRVLVPLIKEELEAGEKAGIEHYRRAGEMLIEARDQINSGEFRGWIDRNFHLSARTAYSYIQLAEASGRAARGATLSKVINPHRESHHRPQWHEPVREIAGRINVDALKKEYDNRERETQLLRKLSHQLIDIGYKVLATKLHPDKGGSAEAMARLNNVRKLLKEAI